MPTVRYSISLDAIQDADIVRWIEAQSKRGASEAIRQAIRAYISQPTMGDLEEKLDNLFNLIRGLRVVEAQTEEPQTEGDEPSAARRGLEAMKRKFSENV